MTHRVFVIADLHLGHGKVALDRGFDNVFAHDNAAVFGAAQEAVGDE